MCNNCTVYFFHAAIETTKDGRVLLEGDTWEYQGCTFQFPGQKMTKGCPQMIAPLCGVYNGAICCARKCAGKNNQISLEVVYFS